MLYADEEQYQLGPIYNQTTIPETQIYVSVQPYISVCVILTLGFVILVFFMVTP